MVRTGPSVTPVQHAHRKVPIEYKEQIECTFNEVVEKRVIALSPNLLNGYHP